MENTDDILGIPSGTLSRTKRVDQLAPGDRIVIRDDHVVSDVWNVRKVVVHMREGLYDVHIARSDKLPVGPNWSPNTQVLEKCDPAYEFVLDGNVAESEDAIEEIAEVATTAAGFIVPSTMDSMTYGERAKNAVFLEAIHRAAELADVAFVKDEHVPFYMLYWGKGGKCRVILPVVNLSFRMKEYDHGRAYECVTVYK